jgi:hypothetical protein
LRSSLLIETNRLLNGQPVRSYSLLLPIQISTLARVLLTNNGSNTGLLRFLERLMTYE